MLTPDQLSQYLAAREGVGYGLLARTRIALSGRDRVTMLHKFCTQDVLGRAIGQGSEAFICNVQGKIVGYVYFFLGDELLLLDTAPGQAEKVINHLDRYVIREDVQFHDLTAEQQVVLVTGPQAAALLQSLTGAAPPSDMYGFRAAQIGEIDIRIEHVPYCIADTYFVSGRAADQENILSQLNAAGGVRADDAVIESLRLEAGTPLYGVDISVENLPQEIARDTQAINFKKGCYLGQETVARIDALGHVNKLLSLVKFPASAAIPVGTELLAGDKVVGRVTSAAWSPQHQAMLALGYVRRELAKRGTRVESSAGPGEIVTIG